MSLTHGNSDRPGKFPSAGHFGPCLSDLPVAMLELDPAPTVKGAGFFNATLPNILEAVLSERFLCINGLWCIDNLDSMNNAARLSRERFAANRLAAKM